MPTGGCSRINWGLKNCSEKNYFLKIEKKRFFCFSLAIFNRTHIWLTPSVIMLMVKVSQREILWRLVFTELLKSLANTIFQNIWQSNVSNSKHVFAKTVIPFFCFIFLILFLLHRHKRTHSEILSQKQSHHRFLIFLKKKKRFFRKKRFSS